MMLYIMGSYTAMEVMCILWSPAFDEELIACENTVLTPHIASSSEGCDSAYVGYRCQ